MINLFTPLATSRFLANGQWDFFTDEARQAEFDFENLQKCYKYFSSFQNLTK
jgi:hypothetical protein